MSLSEASGEYIVAVGKASPPLAVSSVAAAGYSLQDWMFIVTIIYTALQAGLLVYRTIKGKTDGG